MSQINSKYIRGRAGCLTNPIPLFYPFISKKFILILKNTKENSRYESCFFFYHILKNII